MVATKSRVWQGHLEGRKVQTKSRVWQGHWEDRRLDAGFSRGIGKVDG